MKRADSFVRFYQRLRWQILLFALGTLFCDSPLSAQTSINGKVALKKLIPKPAKPKLRKRYGTRPTKSKPTPSPRAVVYLEAIDKPFPKKEVTEKSKMIQEELQFTPHILPIQVGTTVVFPNLDKQYHNVFSYSKVKKFDLGRYISESQNIEEGPEVTFDQAGLVEIFCEIHNHMRASILVLETPYFTTTDTEGNYTLPNVPQGTYNLVLWLGKNKAPLKKQINIEQGKHLTFDFN